MNRSFQKLSLFIALPLTGVVVSQAYVIGQQPGTLIEPAPRTRTTLPPVQDKVVTPQQQKTQHQRNLTTDQRAVPGSHQTAAISMDHMIVHCMNLAAQEEIAFAKFGHEKSKNPEVRAFAEHMIQEHSELAKSLPQHLVKNSSWFHRLSNKPEAVADGVANSVTPQRKTLADGIAGVVDAIDGEQRTVLKPALPADEVQSDSPIVTEGEHREQHHDAVVDVDNSNVLAMQTEIAKQCLEDTKAKLAKEKGETFDQSFVGFQIAMHQSLESKLKVFERHASPEVKPLVEKSLKTTEKHLKQAEELMEKLAQHHAESSTR